MEKLGLRINLYQQSPEGMPIQLYTIGVEPQAPMTRPQGFSAMQCMISLQGSGVFRIYGEEEWSAIPEHSLLYIPAGLPHEYMALDQQHWLLGFVTFTERREGWMAELGFGQQPYCMPLTEVNSLYARMEEMWEITGERPQLWKSAELLLSFCVELHRLQKAERTDIVPTRQPDSVVEAITSFLHDHLERDFSLDELSAYIGYSAKQTVRLFTGRVGMTPHQYLKKIRMETATWLLDHQQQMTVKEIALHVGMEPDYFTRTFKQTYTVTPSEHRQRQLDKKKLWTPGKR